MKTYEKKVILLNTDVIAYRLTTYVWVKRYIFSPKFHVYVRKFTKKVDTQPAVQLDLIKLKKTEVIILPSRNKKNTSSLSVTAGLRWILHQF